MILDHEDEDKPLKSSQKVIASFVAKLTQTCDSISMHSSSDKDWKHKMPMRLVPYSDSEEDELLETSHVSLN